MKRDEERRDIDLIDLGRASVETRGDPVQGPSDSPLFQRRIETVDLQDE